MVVGDALRYVSLMNLLTRAIGIVAALASLAGCVLLPESATGSSPDTASRRVGSARSLETVSVGNNDTVRLDAVTYEGRLVIEANNATVAGAGVGRTVVRGTVVVEGNKNTLRGLTVVGEVRISGNTNDLSGADLSQAEVEARGNNNRY